MLTPRYQRRIYTSLLTTFLLAVGVSTSWAALTAVTSGDFSGVETVVSFPGSGNPFTDPFNEDGVTFDHFSNATFGYLPFNTTHYYPAYAPPSSSGTLPFIFDSPITIVGFDVTLMNSMSLEAFSDTAGTLSLGSLGFGDNATNTPVLIGLVSDTPFRRLVLTASPTSSAAEVENFRYENTGTAPAPASLWLLGSGLALFAAWRRRRQRG
jgi:hypothetical protein